MKPTPGSTRRRQPGPEAGFSLVEVMIAAVIGVVVLASSTSLAVSSWRGLAGVEVRDGVDRSSRFLGTALRRDLQEAGVDLESLPAFGSVYVSNDTLSILRVPYEPSEAPAYTLSSANFPNGVCGANCVEILTGGTAPLLAAGDLARLQANNQRRLVLLTAVAPTAGGYRLQFTTADSLVGRPAGITGLAINAATTFVQKLVATTYWTDNGGRLMRAQQFAADGTLQGEPMATGIQTFHVTLVFTDGHEAASANPNDADGTNDFNDIAAVRIHAVIAADRADPRVNGGNLVTRTREWYLVPRNLVYERNRL